MTLDTGIQPDPIAAAAAAQQQAQPQAAAYENYWGSDETETYMLPDGKQYFVVRPMNEGAKARFQKKTNKGIRVNQQTQDATFDVDPADERHTLIMESVIDWNLMQPDPSDPSGWSQMPVPGNENQRKTAIKNTILEKFNPKLIQDLEFFIRTKNPWMQADMNVEEIDKELERLQKLKDQKLELDAGEDGSANK